MMMSMISENLSSTPASPRGAVRIARRALLPGRTLPVVVVGLAAVALVLAGDAVAWLVGLLAGAAAGAFLVVRGVRVASVGEARRPLPRVQRRTAAALEVLADRGWRVRHDLAGPDATYDHVAVGSGGVILLQSIPADGTVTMRAGEPVVELVDGDGDGVSRLRPHAHADALDLREAIARSTGRRVWVQSVVVVWADFPAGCVVDGRSVFIHGSRLADWMGRRPHQLSPAQIEDVCADIESVAEQRDALLAVAV